LSVVKFSHLIFFSCRCAYNVHVLFLSLNFRASGFIVLQGFCYRYLACEPGTQFDMSQLPQFFCQDINECTSVCTSSRFASLTLTQLNFPLLFSSNKSLFKFSMGIFPLFWMGWEVFARAWCLSDGKEKGSGRVFRLWPPKKTDPLDGASCLVYLRGGQREKLAYP
jgi:hypothetical protein